jgi:hypothetical protein
MIAQWITSDDAGCWSGICLMDPGVTLNIGSTYNWYILPYADSWGLWSTKGTFKVVLPPPTLVEPVGTITQHMPAYKWNAVSGAAKYLLQVKKGTSTIISQWFTSAQANCSSGTGECSVVPIKNLTNASYYWYITASNTATGIGQTSLRSDFTVTPSTTTEIVLTWGANPRDLDAHLWLPASQGNYHVYYDDLGSLTSFPYAQLDIDDQYSYGPEKITIGVPYSGTYRFAVHHYAGSGTLKTSGALVKAYQNGALLRQFSASTATGSSSGIWWDVFDIDVNTGAITVYNTLNSSSPRSISSILGVGGSSGDEVLPPKEPVLSP